MTTVTTWLWFGVAIGAVWAFEGVDGAALTAGMGAIGVLIGTLASQKGGIRNLLDQREDQL